jgi:hypothetical protein
MYLMPEENISALKFSDYPNGAPPVTWHRRVTGRRPLKNYQFQPVHASVLHRKPNRSVIWCRQNLWLVFNSRTTVMVTFFVQIVALIPECRNSNFEKMSVWYQNVRNCLLYLMVRITSLWFLSVTIYWIRLSESECCKSKNCDKNNVHNIVTS